MTSVFIRLALVWACFSGTVSSVFAACPGGKMPTGWCWPLAISNWGNALGWYGYNPDFPNSGNHLAKDIMASEGSSVYAVSRGIVLIVRTNVGNYGGSTCNPTTSVPGAGVVIRHYTAEGKPFEVLYAHLKNVSVQKGDVVEAGAVIAQVGDYTWCGKNIDHLHLGVAFPGRNLSAYDGDRGIPSIWAGYSGTDQGFVNPESFFEMQSIGDIASCNPSKERCPLRINGPIAWYPPVDDCQQASQWFRLVKDATNKVSRIEPATMSACPLACYVN